MKKTVAMVAVLAMASAVAWANCGSCPGDKPADKKAEACCKAGDTVYACLKCSAVSLKAGKCATCAADLKGMNVLSMKDGKISLCPCEAGCKCSVKADDAKQCSCGKAITTLDCATACPVAKKPDAAKVDAEKAKPKDHPAH